MIHCPDGYNRLAIETLADGRRLASATKQAADLFVSRLRLSPDGRRLLTAGWFWHPYGVAGVYDLVHTLEDPAALDQGDAQHEPAVKAEVASACWLTSDQIVLSTNPKKEPPRDSDAVALGPGEPGVWSQAQRQWIARSRSGGHTSILVNQEPVPPVAVDAANRRFAVASDNTVSVIQLPAAAAKQ